MFGPPFTFSLSQGIVRPGGYKAIKVCFRTGRADSPLEHCTRITGSCLIRLRGSNCTFCTSVVSCKADVRHNAVKYLPVHEQENILTQKSGNEALFFYEALPKSVKKLSA